METSVASPSPLLQLLRFSSTHSRHAQGQNVYDFSSTAWLMLTLIDFRLFCTRYVWLAMFVAFGILNQVPTQVTAYLTDTVFLSMVNTTNVVYVDMTPAFLSTHWVCVWVIQMPNASNPMWALILIVSHVLTEDKCYLWLFVVIPIMMLFYVLWLYVYWNVDG